MNFQSIPTLKKRKKGKTNTQKDTTKVPINKQMEN